MVFFLLVFELIFFFETFNFPTILFIIVLKKKITLFSTHRWLFLYMYLTLLILNSYRFYKNEIIIIIE